MSASYLTLNVSRMILMLKSQQMHAVFVNCPSVRYDYYISRSTDDQLQQDRPAALALVAEIRSRWKRTKRSSGAALPSPPLPLVRRATTGDRTRPVSGLVGRFSSLLASSAQCTAFFLASRRPPCVDHPLRCLPARRPTARNPYPWGMLYGPVLVESSCQPQPAQGRQREIASLTKTRPRRAAPHAKDGAEQAARAKGPSGPGEAVGGRGRGRAACR